MSTIKRPHDPSQTTKLPSVLQFGNQVFSSEEPISLHLMATVQQICSLGDLAPNWDAAGARAVDPQIARAAIAFLVDCLPQQAPAPTVVPTPPGGIRLKWYGNDLDLEIEFLSPSQLHAAIDDRKTGDKAEQLYRDDFRPIIPTLQRLEQPA